MPEVSTFVEFTCARCNTSSIVSSSNTLHLSDEKRAQLVKKNIAVQAGIWRKRKRQCIEFISNVEESTDGTISLKKCLKGDGE